MIAWVLPLAAFLFGVALSAVGFVGIWRHTASEADRAHANANTTAERLSRAQDRVRRLEGEIAAGRHGLTAARSTLARTRRMEVALAAKLGAAERTNGLIAARLPGQLSSVDEVAGSLARQSSSLASDLTGLESYLGQSGSRIDPAFLKIQIRYVIRASAGLQADAAQLETRVAAAAGTASSLSGTK